MQKVVVAGAAVIGGAALNLWLENAGFGQWALAFVWVTCAVVVVLNSIGWARLHSWSSRTEGSRRMAALIAFLVVGGMAALGVYAFAKPKADTNHQNGINAVMRWNKYEELERSKSGWGLRAWLEVTSRSDKPMVLSFHFRLTDESKPPALPRIFRVRVDGTDTDTVEIQPFGHKLLVLEVIQDDLQPTPVDMGDAAREYWFDVEDRVSGLNTTLQPGQHYEAGATSNQQPLPPIRIAPSEPTTEAPRSVQAPPTQPGEQPGTSRLARGWTLHKKPDGWLIYLILNTDSLDPATRLALATDAVELPARYVSLANDLHATIRLHSPAPKLVENELGVLPRQRVTEHITHTLLSLSDVLQCSYEIFRDGNNITPNALPTALVKIADLPSVSREAVARFDALMHQMARTRHADALTKSSR